MHKNNKEAVKSGLIGAVFGFSVSFLINYFILAVPETPFNNALGNGISGLISGFMGGFMGLFMYFKTGGHSN